MTIPLPPMPPPQEVEILLNGTVRGVVQGYSDKQVRAIQREAMRVALEAAAKVCRDFHATDSLSNYGLVLARMIDELEVES